MFNENVVRFLRRVASPVLGSTPPDVSEIVVDSTTQSLKFSSNGTKEVMDLGSTQTVTGTKTITAATITAATITTATIANFSGMSNGYRRPGLVGTLATDSLSAGFSGYVWIGTATSGTQVITLGAASSAGVVFTFVCGHADSELHIAVAAGNRIVGKVSADADAVGMISTTTTGLLKNTAATNVVGDYCTLVSDGSVTWYIIGQAGVWSVT